MNCYLQDFFLATSYLLLTLISLSCLSIYVDNVGVQARSFSYGLYTINAIYGVGGALNTISHNFKHVQVIFYVTEITLVLPFYTAEMWLQKNLFPKQEELFYVPCILGLIPLMSFIILGTVRIDLIELSLVYNCVCIAYMGYQTKDYMLIASCFLFYSGYVLHQKGRTLFSNFFFLLFNVAALGTICPNCVEETRKKSDFPFKELGF